MDAQRLAGHGFGGVRLAALGAGWMVGMCYFIGFCLGAADLGRGLPEAAKAVQFRHERN